MAKLTTLYRNHEVTLFLAEARKYKVLSRQEEDEAIRKYREGDLTQRDKIIHSNQLLIYSKAKEYCTSEDDVMDYVSEGNVGLSIAMDANFNPDLGFRFISYAAFYISREMKAYKYGVSQTIRQSNQPKIAAILPRIICDFMGQNEREPSPEEIMDILAQRGIENVDPVDILDLQVVSVDSPVTTRGDDVREYGETKEFVEATASLNGFTKIEENETTKWLSGQMLNILTDRERKVVELFYGINKEGGFMTTSKDIGSMLNLTATRVQQIKKGAIEKMKKYAIENGMRVYKSSDDEEFDELDAEVGA